MLFNIDTEIFKTRPSIHKVQEIIQVHQ